MIHVHLPQALAELAGSSEVVIEASCVLEAVRALKKFHPALPDRILSERLEPRPHVLIFVNEAEVRLLDGAKTVLLGGETLRIVPAVSGG